MLGKFFINILSAASTSMIAEVYPTAVRGFIMAMSTTAGKIGAIVSVFVSALVNYNCAIASCSFLKIKIGGTQGSSQPTLPYIIFGGVSLLSGVLSLLLPEPKGLPLPATIEDCKALEKYFDSKLCLSCNAHFRPFILYMVLRTRIQFTVGRCRKNWSPNNPQSGR